MKQNGRTRIAVKKIKNLTISFRHCRVKFWSCFLMNYLLNTFNLPCWMMYRN